MYACRLRLFRLWKKLKPRYRSYCPAQRSTAQHTHARARAPPPVALPYPIPQTAHDLCSQGLKSLDKADVVQLMRELSLEPNFTKELVKAMIKDERTGEDLSEVANKVEFAAMLHETHPTIDVWKARRAWGKLMEELSALNK